MLLWLASVTYVVIMMVHQNPVACVSDLTATAGTALSISHTGSQYLLCFAVGLQ